MAMGARNARSWTTWARHNALAVTLDPRWERAQLRPEPIAAGSVMMSVRPSAAVDAPVADGLGALAYFL